MHAKVAVIDQRWSTVGSSNIDPFSLLLAREANIVVDDQPFAHELRSNLQRDMESGATIVAKTAWRHQPWSEAGLDLGQLQFCAAADGLDRICR